MLSVRPYSRSIGWLRPCIGHITVPVHTRMPVYLEFLRKGWEEANTHEEAGSWKFVLIFIHHLSVSLTKDPRVNSGNKRNLQD